MDYILKTNDMELLVETEKGASRQEVIAAYRECRKSQHITQMELSNRTGIAQSNIARFEKGNYNPSLDMLIRIAGALGKNIKISLVDKE